MLHFTLLDQVLYCARDVFNGHAGIDPMLVQQIDHIDLEPLERAFGGVLDMLRLAVQAGRRFRSSQDRNPD